MAFMIESSRKTLITIPAGNCLVNNVQPTGQILYAGYEKDMTAYLTLANITGKDLDGTLAGKFRQGSHERKPQHQFIIPASRGDIPGHPDKRRIAVRRHPRHGPDIRNAFFVILNGPDDFLTHQFPVAPVRPVNPVTGQAGFQRRLPRLPVYPRIQDEFDGFMDGTHCRAVFRFLFLIEKSDGSAFRFPVHLHTFSRRYDGSHNDHIPE
jgi:hypothetical protein